MKVFSAILSVLKNKYFIAASLFITWMLFFDPKDWSLIHARQQKLVELEKSEANMTKLIEDTRKERALLKTNAQTIEKYAREKFYMKRDNEDLFLVKSP